MIRRIASIVTAAAVALGLATVPANASVPASQVRACESAAVTLYRTHNYTRSMSSALGQEDSHIVVSILSGAKGHPDRAAKAAATLCRSPYARTPQDVYAAFGRKCSPVASVHSPTIIGILWIYTNGVYRAEYSAYIGSPTSALVQNVRKARALHHPLSFATASAYLRTHCALAAR